MRRASFFIATTALVSAQVVSAQAWTVGEVTPDWPLSTVSGYDWSPAYPVDSAHPADAFEPPVAATDETLYTQESWINQSSNERNPATVNTGNTAKFRTQCRPTFTKMADPILARGQYPAAHPHTFFGSLDPYLIENVQNFNYAMGRAYPKSSCQGGPLNNSLYWEPSMMREVNGLRLTVMPNLATFYYNIEAAHRDEFTRLRRDYNFLGGGNPADFNDTRIRAELAAVGLNYPGGNDPNGNHTPAGFLGFQCSVSEEGGSQPVLAQHAIRSDAGIALATQAKYLKGPNGEDPWNGACGAGFLIVLVNSPDCWDGVNLQSEGGRRHTRYSTRASDNMPAAGTCPNNFVKVPFFETKVQFSHRGWAADLQHWYFSSDRMRMSTTECPDAAAPCDGVSGGNVPATVGGVYYSRVSMSPCRRTGPDFCNGETAHFDWWGAWDHSVMIEWQRNCNGLTIGGITGDYADCGSGGLSANRGLQIGGAAPAGQEHLTAAAGIDTLPPERASASAEGQRYFPIRKDDQAQDALSVDVHDH